MSSRAMARSALATKCHIMSGYLQIQLIDTPRALDSPAAAASLRSTVWLPPGCSRRRLQFPRALTSSMVATAIIVWLTYSNMAGGSPYYSKNTTRGIFSLEPHVSSTRCPCAHALVRRIQEGEHAGAIHRVQHSIGFQYLDRAKGVERNWGALMEVVKWHRGNKPPPSALVIHVRTGDVIDGVNDTMLDLLMLNVPWHGCVPQPGIPENVANWSQWARADARSDRKNWCNYVRTLHYFEDVVLKRLPAGVDCIILVTGSHWPLSSDGKTHCLDDNCNTGTLGSFERSWKYLHVLKGRFEELGFPTSLRMGNSPDDDFVFMSHARYFHTTGGGFSNLIANVVRRMGGYASGLFAHPLEKLYPSWHPRPQTHPGPLMLFGQARPEDPAYPIIRVIPAV